MKFLVHGFVILLVFAAGDGVHPLLIIQIPAHGLFYAFFELQARFPAQFVLQLVAVYGIAQVVPLAVGHVSYQFLRCAFRIAQQAVHRFYDYLDKVYIFPFVEATDIVRISRSAFMENNINSPCMVNYIEPVAHILSFAIDRQRLAVADVVDEERDQLLGKLVGTVIVGAVRHDGRHAVRIVEGAYKVVAACLACRVRAVRLVFSVFCEESPVKFQCPIHFIGRDVVEAFPLISFGQGFPIQFCSLKQGQRAHHVGLREGERIFDASVHMAFGGKVDDAVHAVLRQQFPDGFEVANVRLYKSIVRAAFYIFQVRQVAGISQFVQVDDAVLRIFVHEKAHHMAADKSGAAGYDYVAFE